MTISSVLQTVYASSPTDVVILPTLELVVAGIAPVRLVQAYEDAMLGVDGALRKFEACGMEVALPAKDSSGNQALTFGLGLMDGRAQEIVTVAQESGKPVQLIYREYLSTDVTAPTRAPVVMVVAGGQFSGPTVQVEANYFDMLNISWPRDRYTAANAPGLKYMA